MNMLFCNIGWMKYYNGISEDDQIVGGSSYVKKNKFGSEVYNFSPAGDNFEGYVMTQGNIHIEKLGASPTDTYADGVLVVWVSRMPEGSIRIIGWYKNAKVFRENEDSISSGKRDDGGCRFNIQAGIEDCTLLPVEERIFVIPRTTHKESPGIGQSQIWYAEGEKNMDIIYKVTEYIDNYDRLAKPNVSEQSVNFSEMDEYRYPYCYLISQLTGIEPENISLFDSYKKTFNNLIDTLNPTEKLILILFFGLADGRPMIHEEIINKINMDYLEFVEIMNKALRKLKHPSRIKKIRSCFVKKNDSTELPDVDMLFESIRRDDEK